jgi:hypothetical protein
MRFIEVKKYFWNLHVTNYFLAYVCFEWKDKFLLDVSENKMLSPPPPITSSLALDDKDIQIDTA